MFNSSVGSPITEWLLADDITWLYSLSLIPLSFKNLLKISRHKALFFSMSSGVKAKAPLTMDNISSLRSGDPSKILDLTSSLSEITTPRLSLVKSSLPQSTFKIFVLFSIIL